MARRELTYEDLLRIAEVMRTASHFSEFRLKVGDIEVSVRRTNGAPLPERPVASVESAPRPQVLSKTEIPEGVPAVRAPMVGTFYRAPSPGAPPFVEAGSKVEPGTVVGIIEVMKLMNQIEAGTRGVVKEVLVGNAEQVEHGQALMVIDPR
ncbi:MAG TPA: acetyl-CoA carboxylase biotin carboxyl carrier protein [Burkholderiales bacterium]|jgi:acetyl-CoA carboxylase biotin carboxyl carrier protein|nr:acetyl-CoA carboxylase biotin carboxyl carrier protein [Burkholderiales bacterium]